MDDLIRRQAAIEVIDAVFPVDPMKSEYARGVACGAALAKTYVKQLPSAQPKRGEWVYNPNAYDYGLPAWECDQCGCINANIPPRIMTKDSKPNYAPINPNDFSGSNFCPNCGADMRGDKHETN